MAFEKWLFDDSILLYFAKAILLLFVIGSVCSFIEREEGCPPPTPSAKHWTCPPRAVDEPSNSTPPSPTETSE